jgi:hypothetical protein
MSQFAKTPSRAPANPFGGPAFTGSPDRLGGDEFDPGYVYPVGSWFSSDDDRLPSTSIGPAQGRAFNGFPAQ